MVFHVSVSRSQIDIVSELGTSTDLNLAVHAGDRCNRHQR